MKETNQFSRFQDGEISIIGRTKRKISVDFTQCVIDTLHALRVKPDQVYGDIQNESTSFTLVLVLSISDPENETTKTIKPQNFDGLKALPMIRTTNVPNQLVTSLNQKRGITSPTIPTSPSSTESCLFKPDIYNSNTETSFDSAINELTIVLALRQPTDSEINAYLSKLLCLTSLPTRFNTKTTRPNEQNKFIIFAMLATSKRSQWKFRISDEILFQSRPFLRPTHYEPVPTLKECLKLGILQQTEPNIDQIFRLIFLLHSKSERKEIILKNDHDCTFLTKCPFTINLNEYLKRFSDSYQIANALEDCAAHQIYYKNLDQLNK